MHDAVIDFTKRMVERKHITGRKVLEVGSYDVNGSIRPLIETMKPFQYVGVDARPGPGVDHVVDAEHLCDTMGRFAWGLVVCTETLEHVADWKAAAVQLIDSVAVGGYLLLTTLTPQLPDDPNVVLAHDHWSFTTDNIAAIMQAAGFTATIEPDPEVDGILAYGRKTGAAKRLNIAKKLNIPVQQLQGVERRCCPPVQADVVH